MKRILSIVLILILSLSVLVACGGKNEGTPSASYDLENAKGMLHDLYDSSLAPTKEEANRVTRKDFDVTKVLNAKDGKYTVAWTTDNDAVKVVDYAGSEAGYTAENTATVKLPTDNESDIAYKLTATITAPDGKTTATVTYTLVAPAGMGNKVPGVVENPQVNVPYKFGMYQGNKQAHYFLKGGMSGFYMATTEPDDYMSGLDFYIEATEGGYYMYCFIEGAKTYVNFVVSGTHVNGEYSATPSTVFKFNDKGIFSTMVNDEEYGFGTYNSYVTLGPNKTSYDTNFFGYFYTLVEGTPDQGGNGNENADPVEMTITEALSADLNTNVIVKGQVVTITEVWSSHNNMTVVIADEAGNKILVFRMNTQVEAGDFITVTGTIGEYNGVKQIAQGATAVVTGHEDLVVDPNCHTLAFNDKNNRTSFDTNSQVWQQNGIKLTNTKGSNADAANVADYAAPARFYQHSSVVIEYTGMKKIVFHLNTGKPASGLVDSLAGIDGITVVENGYDVTITFANPVDSFTISAMAAQIRVDSIDVYN